MNKRERVMDKSKWEYKKLGDIALISAGQGAPQGENNYSPDGTPFVKAGNIESLINGLSEYDIQKVNDAVVKSHRLKLYKAGSVLFAKSGMSCMKGLVYTLKNDCYVVSHLAIVTPKDINSHYLNYYFQVHKPNSLIKDSAYPSISLKDIENLIILCPSQTDQQRIVAELDCLNEMIALKQEQLKEFDKLAQSIFYDMFGDPVANDKGWTVTKLNELCKLCQGLAINSKSKHMLSSTGELPLLRIKDMKDGTREIFVNPKECPPSCIADVDDIIYTRTGTLGLVFTNMRGVLHNNCFKINIDKSLLSKTYFMELVGGDFFKNRIVELAKRSSQPDVTHKLFLSQSIILPPLALQQQFADKISAIEAQKELVKKSIAETQHLLDSRMDYYFN